MLTNTLPLLLLLTCFRGPLFAEMPAERSSEGTTRTRVKLKLRPAKLHIEGYNFELAEMREGAVAFSNRRYTWHGVPAEVQGWKFTRTAGGLPAKMIVTAVSDGDIYAAWAVEHEPGNRKLRGWELLKGVYFWYPVPDKTIMRIFKRRMRAGEKMEVFPIAWTGSVILAPEMTARIVPPKPDHSKVPGKVIAYFPAYTKNYVGGPSIVVLRPGVYVVSHTIFGYGNLYGRMHIYRSDDAGKTWRRLAEIPSMHYATLFKHGDALYLIGVWGKSAAILRSSDGGISWTRPRDKKSGLLLTGCDCHSAPTPVVFHAGRIWRAMEDCRRKQYPRDLRAFMMSAPVDSDWLDAENWTMSNAVKPQGVDLPGSQFKEWLEGNAVVAPDGSMIILLRVDDWEGGRAGVVRISSDGKTATFDAKNGFVPMPGGANKFTVRYDPKSKLYWSLVNDVAERTRCGFPAAVVRNKLSLVSSPDLRRWKVNRTVLFHPDRFRHAFQYADWRIEGEDVVAVVRTAFDDGIDGAPNHHDANYLTFHRIRNFRESAPASE